jgi:hypothetical protein
MQGIGVAAVTAFTHTGNGRHVHPTSGSPASRRFMRCRDASGPRRSGSVPTEGIFMAHLGLLESVPRADDNRSNFPPQQQRRTFGSLARSHDDWVSPTRRPAPFTRTSNTNSSFGFDSCGCHQKRGS